MVTRLSTAGGGAVVAVVAGRDAAVVAIAVANGASFMTAIAVVVVVGRDATAVAAIGTGAAVATEDGTRLGACDDGLACTTSVMAPLPPPTL